MRSPHCLCPSLLLLFSFSHHCTIGNAFITVATCGHCIHSRFLLELTIFYAWTWVPSCNSLGHSCVVGNCRVQHPVLWMWPMSPTMLHTSRLGVIVLPYWGWLHYPYFIILISFCYVLPHHFFPLYIYLNRFFVLYLYFVLACNNSHHVSLGSNVSICPCWFWEILDTN